MSNISSNPKNNSHAMNDSQNGSQVDMERYRKTRFTVEELLFLKECVKERYHIIENKDTDTLSAKSRKLAWQEISEEFNGEADFTKRTAKQLKKCWDNHKSKTRKEISENSLLGYSLEPEVVVVTPVPSEDNAEESLNRCLDDTSDNTQPAAATTGKVEFRRQPVRKARLLQDHERELHEVKLEEAILRREIAREELERSRQIGKLLIEKHTLEVELLRKEQRQQQ